MFNDELLFDIKKANYIIKEKKFISWCDLMKEYLNKEKDNKELNENDKNIILRYLKYLNETEKYFLNI